VRVVDRIPLVVLLGLAGLAAYAVVVAASSIGTFAAIADPACDDLAWGLAAIFGCAAGLVATGGVVAAVVQGWRRWGGPLALLAWPPAGRIRWHRAVLATVAVLCLAAVVVGATLPDGHRGCPAPAHGPEAA
jgi:hypothetical protein